MGNLTISSKVLDRYFRFLTRLDNDSKKKLIIKLTESLDSGETKEIADIDKIYGAWVDKRSADEIIAELRKSRIEKNEIEKF